MAGPPWLAALREHARRIDGLRPDRDARTGPTHAAAMALRVGPVYANFARQRYDAAAIAALHAIARGHGLDAALRAMVDGAQVNGSEARPALHTALRSSVGKGSVAFQAHVLAQDALARMEALAAGLASSPVTDIVNIGIGGSDLGPRLAVDALKDQADGRFRIHFVANVDGSSIEHALRHLDPARTAAILVSKSFGTQETLLNGAIVRDWLGDDRRLHAVTANLPGAEAFGVDASRVLPMWDWVGGRYSLWSAVGFAVALAVGMPNFRALLAGASEMDAHALEAPLDANLPVLHALTAVWNRNALGLSSQAIIPYDERLALLPAYLQQLVMESLGKSVRHDGQAVDLATVPVTWGGAGSSVQHSFLQALHQGTEVVPVDFIGTVRPAHAHAGSHAVLLANLLAQSEALANGHAADEAQASHPGGRPSTLFLLDELTPRSLGMLLALYEHSVYLQSVLWGINAFDQWGVELGKRIAGDLLPALRGHGDVVDPVTRALVDEIRRRGAEAD